MLFVKPAGAACNLECRYCYYLDKLSLASPGVAPRMPVDLLERYIVQHFEAASDPVVTFSWHGGEPTLLGVEYFQQVVALQRRHCPRGTRVSNGMQTNGLLLDEAWCRFLAREEFRVGLSLDGPAEMHDAYRVARGGQPTHARVMRAFELLQRHRIPHDILCVVHDGNVRRPLSVYRFFRRIGARALGFLPLVERGPDGAVRPFTVPAGAYGAFLCAIFDEWVERDTERIAVQAFDEATRPARGLDHALCIFRETCGEVPVLEHNGDVYSCDHFVDAGHRVGNIREVSLATLLEHPAQRAFGLAKRETLPRACRECDVLPQCHGGCPKDRFLLTPDGEAGLNYLCAGYKRFFRHVQPYAARLAREQPARPTLADLVPLEPGQPTAAPAEPGRNDPCPCGSGRKYKRCCARSPGEKLQAGSE